MFQMRYFSLYFVLRKSAKISTLLGQHLLVTKIRSDILVMSNFKEFDELFMIEGARVLEDDEFDLAGFILFVVSCCFVSLIIIIDES